MTIKKALNWGTLITVACLTIPVWVLADMKDANQAPSNDKMGTNGTPSYSAGTPDNSSTSTYTSSETATVPSGKRHRTHKKHGNKAQSADANKTINASDVTPSN